MERELFITELIKLYKKGSLMQQALKFTRDQDEAADLLQNTFEHAFKSINTYMRNENMEGWLYRIMQRLFFSNYRLKLKIEKVQLDPKILKDLADYDYFEEEETYPMKIYADVFKVLGPENYNIFDMYTRRCSYKEISEKTGLKLGTVKSRIHYIKLKLHTTYEESKIKGCKI